MDDMERDWALEAVEIEARERARELQYFYE